MSTGGDLACPVCRAGNAVGPQCRRCRADLGLLFDLQKDRGLLLAQARQAMHQGAWPQALDRIRAAETLCAGDAKRWEAVCQLLQGNFPAAWGCYLDQGTAGSHRQP
jgi:hypothetical protein